MRTRSLALIGVSAAALAAGAPGLAGAQTTVTTPIDGATGLLPVDGPDLTLRRVMLSTGGVGYFEYETRVVGDADLMLRVRLDQVDDVLKSIVVYDDEGGIGSISLPGQQPLRETFRDLPFTPEDLSSPVALFNALRGAEVVASGPRQITGRLLSVNPETTELPDGGTITRHRVSIMTAVGIQQLILEETNALAFADPALSAQVESALAALARHGEADSRTLTVNMEGGGDRTVNVAYVVEAPLWKATYRLTLSSDPAIEEAAAQGWAVLENLSGEDWTGVELSVVSGNPVTFRQALYDAYYVARPEVPVEVLGRVLPPVDRGGVAVMDMLGRDDERARTLGATGGAMPGAPIMAMPMPAPMPYATAEALARPPAEAQLLAAESSEAATQVVFRVPHPVTVASGESVLVPIVAQSIPAERLSLYQPGVHDRHPLASVRLSNDTGTGLPPGVLTLYERDAGTGGVSYLGDARLNPLPAGEDRLISFAVDQKVTIDSEARTARTVQQGRIVDGILQLSIVDRQTTVYTIQGAADEDRLVLIEHPRVPGWDLADRPGETIERTDTAYRVPVRVAAGETVRVEVTLQRPRVERIELARIDLSQINVWATSSELTPEVRAALAELAGYRREIAGIEQSLRDAERARDLVVTEQRRIRDNLQAVPRDSDIYRRYLDTLSEQEDELAEFADTVATLQGNLRDAQARLAEYVRTLSL